MTFFGFVGIIKSRFILTTELEAVLRQYNELFIGVITMEELLAYAYLLENGFNVQKQYDIKLNELFINNPNDKDLLELEIISGDTKKCICYIKTHIDYFNMNRSKFGKELMELLKPFYKSLSINTFGDRMYSLWESLAGNLQDEEPFFTLCYADDFISWNENQARKKYEEMLSYYDN